MRNLGKITIILAIWFAPFLLSITGCEEKQLQPIDKLVTDANNIVTAGGAILQSPAGDLLPPLWQVIGALAIAIGSILVNGWQKVRANLMKKTTKAIVKGIEAAEQVEKPNPTNPVKAAIGDQMRAAGIYDKGNEIVDLLKVSR